MDFKYFWNTSFEVPDKAVFLDKLDRGIAEFSIGSDVDDDFKRESYVPVTVTLTKISDNILPLIDILKVVIGEAYSTHVDHINTMFVENSVVFIPYTQDGNRIWVDSRHIITFPVKDWTDKKLLSTDPLTRYVVEKYLPLDVTYYTVKNTTLALIPQDSQGSQNSQDEIEIDREINTLLKQGYFDYPFS